MAPTRADRAHLPQRFHNAFFSHFFRSSSDRSIDRSNVEVEGDAKMLYQERFEKDPRALETCFTLKLLLVIEQTRHLIGSTRARYIA